MQLVDFSGPARWNDRQPEPKSKTRLEINSIPLAGVVSHDEARSADQARTDFATIESDLQFLMAQLARIPTRKEQARNALGIIFATAMLTTLAVLWFTGYWRYCL